MATSTYPSVVNLDERRPHISGEAKCLVCGHGFVAVLQYPMESWEFQCPECSTYRAVLVYPIAEGFQRAACVNCNCDTFAVYLKDGAFVASCCRCGGSCDVGIER